MKFQRIFFLLISAGLLVFAASTQKYESTMNACLMPASRKMIALGFDDGPRADTTARLLDGLRDRGAKATFFLVGRQIAPNAALVKRIKEEGHQIGNHTWDHKDLRGQPDSVVLKEISRTDEVLRQLLGDDEYWVRPPFGLIDQKQERMIPVPLVKWSVDPWDWKLKNVDQDVAAVLKTAKAGDIILMHDTVPESVDAALKVIDILQAKGYEFVTVKELLEQSGVQPKAGVMYYSDKRSK